MLDSKRIDEIYELLDKSSVKLPKDAYLMGPKYINNILAKVREKCDTLEDILRETNRARVSTKRILTGKKRMKKLDFNTLIATNEEVRKQKSQAAREAYAENLLKAKILELIELEQSLLDIDAICVAIENALSNLKDTRVDINRMIHLMDLQIKNLGGGLNEDSGDDLVDESLNDADLSLIKGQSKKDEADDLLNEEDDLVIEIENEEPIGTDGDDEGENDENDDEEDEDFVIIDEEDNEKDFESLDFDDLTS